MPSLPLSLRVAGRRAVIVGGGAVAVHKCASLLRADAAVTVIAAAPVEELRALAAEGRIALAERTYTSGDLRDALLAVAATDDDAVNARVVADANAARVLVVDAGDRERGDAAMPSVSRVGDVVIAVDTGGSSPAFAKRISREAGERFGESYARAARVLAHARTYLRALCPPAERRAAMRELSELPIERLATITAIDIEHDAETIVERLRGAGGAASATRSVTCASRASALAMTQTRFVAARLAQRGIATTILNVTTTGDRITDRAIGKIGSENVFVTELEHALRDGRADYAVHSCKDLPSVLAEGMQLVAISSREDPRDAFCSERYATFAELPPGARVGTSSPRRRAQLHALRGDLRYEEMRGNVDTRLRKLREGRYDAIVLAMAGLNRLKARAAYTVPFDVETLVPAAAQGALAIETRIGAAVAPDLRAALNDEVAERCVAAERAVLRELHAGCTAPIGAYARVEGARMHLHVAFSTGEGIGARIEHARASDEAASIERAEALGTRAARELLVGLANAGLEGSAP